jgi:PHS family inorganic phosphate transporter-like MFS transporter
VGLVVVVAYKSVLLEDSPTNLNHVDFMWRLLIGLGCVPGVIALYFRLTIPETPRYTMDIERNVKQASVDIDNVLTTGTFVVDPDAAVQRVQAPQASRRDFAAYFSKWENLKILIGTSYSWFALDVSDCRQPREQDFNHAPLFRSHSTVSVSIRVSSWNDSASVLL